MSKFGKTVLAVTAVGVVAAGAYFYIKKKKQEVPTNMGEDDIEVTADGEATEKRSYVNLDFNAVEEKAKAAAGKVADVAAKAGTTIGGFVTQAEGKVEEFFNDKKEEVAAVVDEASEKVEEVGNAAAEKAETVAEEVAETVCEAGEAVEEATESKED